MVRDKRHPPDTARIIMAITRTADGNLIIGEPSLGGRAIGISEVEDNHDIAFVDWFEEGVGMGLTLEEAVAARDELNRIIRKSAAR
jgi:hypothetical protein